MYVALQGAHYILTENAIFKRVGHIFLRKDDMKKHEYYQMLKDYKRFDSFCIRIWKEVVGIEKLEALLLICL